MKLLILLALVVMIAEALAKPDGHFPEKFDSINVDEMTSNPRLLCPHVKCFSDKGPCTAEGKDLKPYVSSGVQDACGECTDAQKKKVATIMKAMREKCADDFKVLYEKFDPNGAREAEMNEFIAKHSS